MNLIITYFVLSVVQDEKEWPQRHESEETHETEEHWYVKFVLQEYHISW